MKKIPVLKCNQKETTFYLMSCDPREIIKFVDIPTENINQEHQRPWNKKRVEDIALYVDGKVDLSDDKSSPVPAKGILPNCPILNILSPLKIIESNGASFLELPENEIEIKECCGNIKILDGQHRLISFSNNYIKMNDPIYEMGFVIFENLDIYQMREIFMVTNDKQEKVESNVLRQLKKWLKLLSLEEDSIYDIVEQLNEKETSPLYKRIIIGGEKISRGLKLTQVSKILNQSKIYELLENSTLDTQVQILCNYLNAWKSVYTEIYNIPNHVINKIAGLRYILFIFPYIYQIAQDSRNPLTEEYIKTLIHEFYIMTGGSLMFDDPQIKLAFRGESSTIALAKRQGNSLKDKVLSNVFDPTII